jgi:osmotically-inducible protein OsmY
MARSARLFALALVMALPMLLGGCVGALVVGGLAAAGSAGYVAGQERGVDGTASDFAIKTGIENAFIHTDPRLQSSITTTVYNHRVLLTGRVPNPEMKAAAVQIAGRTQDVRAVYDEIELAPSEGMWDSAQDTWISTRVRSDMVLDPAIRSANYTVDTENGSVYLIGSARSQAELDRATRIARYVPGVKRVVSYVEMRSGEPVAAAPGGHTPAGTAALDNPSAAPKSAIEVQKL